MPIKIPDKLPAAKVLREENIFVMTEKRAQSQDIRPLRIVILNLMPTKIVTETQLLRLLGNTPLQVEVDLIKTETYQSKNTSFEHLFKFYKVFDDIKDQKYDGMIITGAPVELMEFEEVEYWDELCRIMEWSKKNVTSTIHICWGAQAGLYYHYGVKKIKLEEKLSGVYEHQLCAKNVKLTRGFDDVFYAPHSRFTTVSERLVRSIPELQVLANSEKAGLYLCASKDGRQIFITGHSEYDSNTLALEYIRDVDKGLDPKVPENYFPEDDPKKQPKVNWKAHATLLFSNWLNYYLYQETPYDVTDIGKSFSKKEE